MSLTRVQTIAPQYSTLQHTASSMGAQGAHLARYGTRSSWLQHELVAQKGLKQSKLMIHYKPSKQKHEVSGASIAKVT
jgi:hypothetical protein